MARYLDPKTDLTFKRIFADHPELLIDFLNAVMPFDSDRQIVSIEYLPSELVPDHQDKKNTIVDVRCKDNYKRQFIIEIQMYWFSSFLQRIVFNAGKAYVRQLNKAHDFNLLQPVYTLAILSKNFDDKTAQFYHHYQIVNRENTDEIIPGLEFVLIELTDKFRPESISDRRLMVLWLRFLKEVDEQMRVLPTELQENENIRKAAELCEIGCFSDAELAAYERFWDMILVDKDLKFTWRQEGLEEGRKQGIEQGIEQGRVEGRAEGLAEGEIKTMERIVIEGKLNGFSTEQIQSLTKLSIEQLNEILMRNKLV